jgi:hypothetical protein
MIALDRRYAARTKNRVCESSHGIFLETCIIPRMMIKLVLRWNQHSVGVNWEGEQEYAHLRTKTGHFESGMKTCVLIYTSNSKNEVVIECDHLN